MDELFVSLNEEDRIVNRFEQNIFVKILFRTIVKSWRKLAKFVDAEQV